MKTLVLAVLLVGCARHPVATVAIGAGSVGLLTCEANSLSLWRSHDTAHVQATCGIFTAGAALFLGGLTAIITHFAEAEPIAPPAEEHMLPSGAVRVRTRTEPPPPSVDAGVAPAPPAQGSASPPPTMGP